MEFEAIVQKLKEQWPEVEVIKGEVGDSVCLIPAEKNVEILTYLNEDPDLAFDSLMTIAGADSGLTLWVVYPLHSFKHLHKIIVKAVLPREDAEIGSVVKLWAAAEILEREVYDLYGIKFIGHPDLRRILNPPDWEGWPGRKDFEFPMDYQGIPTVRQDQFFDDEVQKSTDELDKKTKVVADQVAAEVKKETEAQQKQESAS